MNLTVIPMVMSHEWARTYRSVESRRHERKELQGKVDEYLKSDGRIRHYDNFGRLIGWTIRNPTTGADEFCENTHLTSVGSGKKSSESSVPNVAGM